MGWIVAALAGLCVISASAGTAAERTDVEQLKKRPENFVGKTVSISGIISIATREQALFTFKAGRLKDGFFPMRWPDRGAAWEFAQYECSGAEDSRKCNANVIGELRTLEGFENSYVIYAQEVEFAPN